MTARLRVSLFLPLDAREARQRNASADTCLLRIGALDRGDDGVTRAMADVLWGQLRSGETLCALAVGEFVNIRHLAASTPTLDVELARSGIVTVRNRESLEVLLVHWRAEELVLGLFAVLAPQVELTPDDLEHPKRIGSGASLGLRCVYARDHISLEVAGPKARVMAAFEATIGLQA